MPGENDGWWTIDEVRADQNLATRLAGVDVRTGVATGDIKTLQNTGLIAIAAIERGDEATLRALHEQGYNFSTPVRLPSADEHSDTTAKRFASGGYDAAHTSSAELMRTLQPLQKTKRQPPGVATLG